MKDLSGLDQVALKNKITSKTTVSIDKVAKKDQMQEAEALTDAKNIEITMEEADHAFALMTEIRQKIETAYHELTAKLDNN
jgi:flagellar hook-basal body complex protein FliE